MALYKVLCAVAVTIFLAPNETVSMFHGTECGQGGQDLQPVNMTWRVWITGVNLTCGGTLISDSKVLTSCRCNASVTEVKLTIGQNETPFGATAFEVFDDEESGANYRFPCVYTLSQPSDMTPICPPARDSDIEAGTEVVVDQCEGEITSPYDCNIAPDSGYQLCVRYTVNADECEVKDGAGAVYFDEEMTVWRLSGFLRQDVRNENDSTVITTVSFSDNDNIIVDFNDTTTTPMQQTTDFLFPTSFPFTDFLNFTKPPKPPTKCPKPHPPKTTKPPCGCGDGEDDFRDDSLFGSGVMMNSSPFILLCVLVISLYSTYC